MKAWVARTNHWPAGMPPRALALGRVFRVVVDQHQVEVGADHHLPPARLAERDDRHAPARHMAEARPEIGEHTRQQRGDRGVRQPCAAQARLVRVQPPVHRRDRDVEVLLADGAAGDRDRVLEAARDLQPAFDE